LALDDFGSEGWRNVRASGRFSGARCDKTNH
jgi:hypothetical protein